MELQKVMELQKESLLFLVVILGAYGADTIKTNFLYGMIALLGAAGAIILRSYLKKKGWELGRR